MLNLPPIKQFDGQPIYNIGVVSRITKVSMPTLRAWERRYQFPDIKRGDGGHRLYSEQDVYRLRWVKARIDDGMQTAHAIKALQNLEQSNLEIHAMQLDKSSGLIGQGKSQYLKDIQKLLVQAMRDHDLGKSDELFGDALAISQPEYLIYELIVPTMAELGMLWEANQISIATEHLATNYLRQRLMSWMFNSPPALNIRPIILSCAPSEWHEGSLLVLGAILRRRRYPILYLGQNVAFIELENLIREVSPNIIVMVAMTKESALQLKEWPNHLPLVHQTGKPIFGFGGRAFIDDREMQKEITGLYLGDTFQEGIISIENVLNL